MATRSSLIVAAEDGVRRAGPRRGVCLAEAADYVGVGLSKFLAMVEDGRMPRPKEIDRRRVWDLRALDRAFDELPGDDRYAADPTPPLPKAGSIVL